MKKVYVTPTITIYVVQSASLCQMSRSNKEISADNAGLSNSFSGGLLDDDTQGGGLWDEANEY